MNNPSERIPRRHALEVLGLLSFAVVAAACGVGSSAQPSPTKTPEASGVDTLQTQEEKDFRNRWPQTAEEFVAAINVDDQSIPAEMQADPYYRRLVPEMVTKEIDKDGNWTGGFQVLFERNAGDGDRFPYVVIKNLGPMMQYGYMHDPSLRQRAGLTTEEVEKLGIGENHIGAGIPVTKSPVAVEGLTFYPFLNTIDGSNNPHSLWTTLGPDMQTMDARLVRSAGQ